VSEAGAARDVRKEGVRGRAEGGEGGGGSGQNEQRMEVGEVGDEERARVGIERLKEGGGVVVGRRHACGTARVSMRSGGVCLSLV